MALRHRGLVLSLLLVRLDQRDWDLPSLLPDPSIEQLLSEHSIVDSCAAGIHDVRVWTAHWQVVRQSGTEVYTVNRNISACLRIDDDFIGFGILSNHTGARCLLGSRC